MLFKKIKVTPEGVYMLDPEIRGKINRGVLSPSSIGSWLKSPGDWVLDKYIMAEVQRKETPHLKRGNWFHSTMEDFFSKPQDKRTQQDLLESSKKVTASEEYREFAKDPENQEWYKKALMGYIKNWLPTAKDEKIATLFIMGQSQKGVELKISGSIGNAKRRCFGFIDKIVEGENGLIVQDWKTGKSITDFDPTKKISENNPFDYWRQQTFYSMLLEQAGATVEEASLIFPCSEPPAIVTIDHSNDKVRAQVVKDVEQVDKEMQEAIDNNYFFPFKKGKYNSWASYLAGMGSARKPDILEDKFQMLADLSEVGGQA